MIEIDLYNQLKNDTLITDLVGTRIYPKKAPQNVQTPYLIYHEIIGSGKQCMSGSIYQTVTRFQIDCWGLKYSDVKNLREAVKSSIIGFKSSSNITTDDSYEPETQLFREKIDFKLKG